MIDSGDFIAVIVSCHNKQAVTSSIALLHAHLWLKPRPSYFTPAYSQGFFTDAHGELLIFWFLVADHHCYPQQDARSGSHHCAAQPLGCKVTDLGQSKAGGGQCLFETARPSPRLLDTRSRAGAACLWENGGAV